MLQGGLAGLLGLDGLLITNPVQLPQQRRGIHRRGILRGRGLRAEERRGGEEREGDGRDGKTEGTHAELTAGDAPEASPHHARLHRMHAPAGARFEIIEAIQMEQAVDEVERDLVIHGLSIVAGLGLRGFRADHDVAVLEGDHIGRSFDAHEFDVKLRDPAIGDDRHTDLLDPGQRKALVPGEGQTLRNSHGGEATQPGQVEPDAPLEIADGEFGKMGRLRAQRFRPDLGLRSALRLPHSAFHHAAEIGGWMPERDGEGVSRFSVFSPGYETRLCIMLWSV